MHINSIVWNNPTVVLGEKFHRSRETYYNFDLKAMLSALGLLLWTIKRETVFVVSVRFREKVIRANTKTCCFPLAFFLNRGHWRSHDINSFSWSVLLASEIVCLKATYCFGTDRWIYASLLARLWRFFSSLFFISFR